MKILRLVAPLLDVYDRKGKCIVYVDSKSDRQEIKQNVLKFSFDTTQENNYNFPSYYRHCTNVDEDPFNECKPVNCEIHYNGKKSYFSRKFKRCIDVPACNSDSDYPSVVYNPITNTCLEESITEDDLNSIKNLENNRKHRTGKDIFIIGKFEPNVTEFIDTVDLLDEYSIAAKAKAFQAKSYLKANSYKNILTRYFTNSKWTLIILSFVITVQCVLICTMMYCLSRTCNCLEDKKVVRKFFNYRQDVSVTTPLIGTSNIDTEMDYQYINESNTDQKIKSYKACNKDNSHLKMAMSDDILSKCLNRRDWKRIKSEVTNDYNFDNKILLQDIQNNVYKEPTKINETKVAFEDEVKDSNKKRSKIVNIVNTEEKINDNYKDDNADIDISSEKEIKCHSYNYTNGTNYPNSKECYNTEITKNVVKTHSTEKGAQAYFSNDSIDDFLSERGVIYMAGENISKYTFSNDSNDVKPSSSKTSKSFIKNVLSLLHKKSKPGPSSDPGQNKEVHLIHMSKASVYSSSNDSTCMKTLKRSESRTSF